MLSSPLIYTIYVSKGGLCPLLSANFNLPQELVSWFSRSKIRETNASRNRFRCWSCEKHPKWMIWYGYVSVTCTPGTYWDDTKKKCVDCALGTYQTMNNQPSCTPCVAGNTTATTGATSASQCIGEYSALPMPHRQISPWCPLMTHRPSLLARWRLSCFHSCFMGSCFCWKTKDYVHSILMAKRKTAETLSLLHWNNCNLVPGLIYGSKKCLG